MQEDGNRYRFTEAQIYLENTKNNKNKNNAKQ